VEAAAVKHGDVDKQRDRRRAGCSSGIDGFGARQDAPAGVDVGRHARVDCAYHLQAILDGAEHRQRQVLERLRREPEPGVIRDVDERVGSELRGTTSKTWKDVLVTNKRRELKTTSAHI